jgi:hypothetical protein
MFRHGWQRALKEAPYARMRAGPATRPAKDGRAGRSEARVCSGMDGNALRKEAPYARIARRSGFTTGQPEARADFAMDGKAF